MQNTSQLTHLYIESNPNPNSLKFVANFMLVPEGESFDFPDKASAENAPLAQELFNYDFVDRVFYMNNFVTVTKKEDYEWDEIKLKIRDHIKSYLEQNKPVLTELTASQNEVSENDSPEVQQIKMVLDEYIRPAVEQDGGAITFQSFEEGTLRLNLQGACSGCPSSTVTLKAGIENLMQRMVPQVKKVEAVGV
ncbi:MAG: NifU family protein [Candidatus Cyclobacteriaceae bacterium M2_1C_046]